MIQALSRCQSCKRLHAPHCGDGPAAGQPTSYGEGCGRQRSSNEDTSRLPGHIVTHARDAQTEAVTHKASTPAERQAARRSKLGEAYKVANKERMRLKRTKP